MTRPAISSKVLLVRDRRGEAPEPAPAAVKRYRLARLRFDARSTPVDVRFDHLKRAYD